MDELRTKAVVSWNAMEQKFLSFEVTYKRESFEGHGTDIKHVVTQEIILAFDAKRSLTLLRTRNLANPRALNHQVANSRYVLKCRAIMNLKKEILLIFARKMSQPFQYQPRKMRTELRLGKDIVVT